MSTVVITYNGTDITASVLFARTSFESQMGGIPGSFEIAVRDTTQTLSFSTGKEIVCTIDGTRYFGGYLTHVTRTFALPMADTTVAANVKLRQWILRGVDYNILFDTRVIYNKASPLDATAIQSDPYTDQEAVQKLCNDYLDLDGEIDFSTYVDSVESLTTATSEFAFAPPGSKWRDGMTQITNKTGAIFYIDHSKALHYHRFETLRWTDGTNQLGFADKPNNTTTFGFREMQYIEDGSQIVNDALVWGGADLGSTGLTGQTVFAEVENTDSQAAGGRWQKAETHFNEIGYFETADVERRGKIIVQGDPGTVVVVGIGPDDQRGLQNAQRQIKLTWFSTDVPVQLTPGTVVNIFLYVFGMPALQLALPCRSIRVSFPTPTVARFDGFFGIQTSDPWSLWKYMKTAKDRTAIPPTTTVVTSDGSSGASVPGTWVCTTPTPAPDGATTEFMLTDSYMALTTQVWLNGLLQRPGYEYTETSPSGKTITFVDAPLVGDQLWVCYYSSGA